MIKPMPITAGNFFEFWYFVPLGLIAWVLFKRGKSAWETAKPMVFSVAAVILAVIWVIMVSGTLTLWMLWNAKVMGHEMIF